jgi:hypothetical protein
MKICIPSKGRAETMSTHLFFDPIDVLIFVEPQEIEKYRLFWPEYTFVDIEDSDRGISYARNFILDHVDGENIIMSDDDYLSFGKRNEKYRYDKLINCTEIINKILKGLENGFVGYGIADSVFSYHQNKDSDNKEKYENCQILMDFYGLNTKWIKEKEIRFDENMKEGEDSDLSIQILINDGNICNDYSYCRVKKYRNSGGLQKERGWFLDRDKENRRYINYLSEKYGSEFVITSHDRDGYLKNKKIKFDLIKKRREVVKNNIERYKSRFA